MATMAETSEARRRNPSSRRIVLAALVLVVSFGAYLRFLGLGTRSLWLDEFATWHLSRMPLVDSLCWQPELTKPPGYPLCLRLMTDDPHPPEWLLRFPAAVCGALTIIAVWWLGRVGGGWATGCALAGLVACNALQIRHSQEARAYTMMVLGCTMSVALWHRLVTDPRPRYLPGYIITTVLTFHAHYLTLLTILAEACWWMVIRVWPRGSSKTPPDDLRSGGTAQREVRHPESLGQAPHPQSLRPLGALAVVGLLCAPIVLHYLFLRSSVFQGLGWIEPPTWRSSIEVLGQLTFGGLWVWALLAPSIVLWLIGSRRCFIKGLPCPGGELFCGRSDIFVLLLVWFACVWFGLLVISWITQPALLARYAATAAIPALLMPLLVAHRLDRRAPLIIMVVFAVRAAPDWVAQATEYEPGFRELTAFLNERVDPETEGVLFVIDNSGHPQWEDMDRLAFQYYPLDNIPLYDLHLKPDGVTPETGILQEDPRAFYLIVLQADPFAILEAGGREARPIELEGESYRQLPFKPYRLVLVAPMARD